MSLIFLFAWTALWGAFTLPGHPSVPWAEAAAVSGFVGEHPALPREDSLRVRVRVEGIRGELRRNVVAHLRLSREAGRGRVLHEGEVRRLHARSRHEIEAALIPFGYYRPEVEDELTVERGSWLATYRVRPGEPVRVTSVEARVEGDGAEDPALMEAADDFRLREGDPLRHSSWEQAKRALQTAALERGYLDATFGERRVEVDPDRGTAAVRVILESGPLYRFGAVRFTGGDLQEALLLGFVAFQEGDPATTASLLALQNTLQASGLFSSVEASLLRDEAAGVVVPVEVRLTPRPRRRYDAGLGFGTDTGPRGVLGAEFRRLNQAGHGLVAEIRASRIQNGLDASYLIPLPGAAGNRIAVTTGLLDERTQGIRSTRAGLGVGWHRSRGPWRESWLLDVQREHSGEEGEVVRSTMVLPGVQWNRTEFDDPTYATRGWRVRLELIGAHREFFSEATFGRALARLGAVVSPWERGRILMRTEVGSTWVDDVGELPLSLRFYTGGDRTVRGFAYRSLGPTSPDGAVVGGRHLFVVSTEVEQLIRGGWGGAVFVDAGNASNDWPVSPRAGVGAGVRWRSPVGLVRADAAVALSESGNPWRFHLSVGPGL